MRRPRRRSSRRAQAAQEVPLCYVDSIERQRTEARKSIRRIEPWRLVVKRRPELAPLRPAYLALLRRLARIVAAPRPDFLVSGIPWTAPKRLTLPNMAKNNSNEPSR